MLRKVFFAAQLFFAVVFSLSVHSAAAAACLRGHTVDSAGAGLAGVVVTVSGSEGNGSHSTTSDSTGQFEVCGLQPGRYHVSGSKDSYQDSRREANLRANADASLTLTLAAKSAQMAAPLPAAGPASASGEFRAGIASASEPVIPDAPDSSRKNLPHGKIYGLFGSSDATLNNQLGVAQYGGSMGGSFGGGSLGQGRTSWFLGFDQFALNEPRLLSMLAAKGPLPNSANPPASSALTARVDHRFSQSDSAYLRFNRDDLRSYSLRPGANGNPPTLTTNFKLGHQQAELANTVNLSPNTVNETHVQYVASDAQLPPGTTDGAVQSSLPTERRDRVFEAANNVYRQMGEHSLRMGGDFLYGQTNLSFLESSLGRASAGNSYFSQSGRDAGLYVQGQHKLASNLVATTGIRYNVQSLQGFKSDVNNVAPQLGLAWSPASHTVIRGGVGIYYDQIPLPAIAGSADSSTAVSSTAANIESSGSFLSRNGRTAQQLGFFTTRPPAMQSSYAETASFAVEQQIGTKSALTAETQYVRGVQLALPVLRSTALCASTSSCNSGNTFWGQELGSGANSSYTGSTIAFTQQPARWGNYKVAYTYAKATSSGMGENTSSFEDRLRRLSFTGVLHTSAEPASDIWQALTRGFVLTGTTDYSQRSEFTGMSFLNFNTRLAKTIAWGKSYHLEALFQDFSMLQRTSASLMRSEAAMGINSAAVFATYKQVAALQNPGGSQLGMRLTF